MKGAPPEVHNHVYRTFIEDKQARYFVTSIKYGGKQLTDDGLKISETVRGNHAMGEGSMTFHIYNKINDKKSSSLNWLFPTMESMQVRSAFEFGGKFQYFTHKKRRNDKKLIKRVSEIEE